MSGRTISDQTRRWLVGELDVWRGRGILSADQAGDILRLYETPADVAQRNRSTALLVLTGLATLLIGVAVLLLVGYNWQAMPASGKIGILLAAIAGAHGLGFFLRFGRCAYVSSEVAFFFGCLLYGVAIWQIAQIFHMETHYPDGVWKWAVGTFLFALCLRTPLLHILFVALMGLWAGMEVLGFTDLGGWWFGRWAALPNGAYSLPLLALPGLLWAYRNNSVATAALYVLLLGWWATLQPLAWHWEESAIYFVGAVGALFLLIAGLHQRNSRFAVIHRVCGVFLVAGVLVPLSFFTFNRELLQSLFAKPHCMLQGLLAGPIIVLVSIVVVAVAAFLARNRAGDLFSLPDRIVALVRSQWPLVVLLLVMAVLPAVSVLLGSQDMTRMAAAVPTVMANAGMLLLALWLIQLGLREDRGQPFAAGIAYFLFWTILRYADLFADFAGMPGAALLFFLCGGGLFGVAIYWRHRKETRHA